MLRPEALERHTFADRSVFEAQSAVLDGHATRLYLKLARFLDETIGRAPMQFKAPQRPVNVFVGPLLAVPRF